MKKIQARILSKYKKNGTGYLHIFKKKLKKNGEKGKSKQRSHRFKVILEKRRQEGIEEFNTRVRKVQKSF